VLIKNIINPISPRPAETTKAALELYKSQSRPIKREAGSKDMPITVFNRP